MVNFGPGWFSALLSKRLPHGLRHPRSGTQADAPSQQQPAASGQQSAGRERTDDGDKPLHVLPVGPANLLACARGASEPSRFNRSIKEMMHPCLIYQRTIFGCAFTEPSGDAEGVCVCVHVWVFGCGGARKCEGVRMCMRACVYVV